MGVVLASVYPPPKLAGEVQVMLKLSVTFISSPGRYDDLFKSIVIVPAQS